MGFGYAIAMVLAGAAVASTLFVATVLIRGRASAALRSRPTRESIEASIVSEVLVSGGMTRGEAHEFLRGEMKLEDDIVDDIDLQNWAEEYGSRYGADAAGALLSMTVKAAVMTSPVVPLPQYNALLDLCFRLGLQTDSLARLRAQYRFAYVDYAKQNRPRSADRAARRAVSAVDTGEMMKLLELGETATRQQVVSAYRRLAAQWHPDRFHDAAEEEQTAAAERFIRLTEAYERILANCAEN